MKNIFSPEFFAFLLAFFISTASYGQQYYIGFDAGYGLKINSPSSVWNTENTNITETNVSREKFLYSLGQGFQVGLSAGNMFNENIGVEVGLAYHIGKPFETYYFQNNNYNTTNVYYSQSAQSIRVSPAFIFQLKPDAKFSPYMKTGLIFSKASIETSREDENEKILYKYSQGINLGVLSSLGAAYHLNDKLALVTEFKIQLLNYAPGKRVLTEYNINGVDQLPGMTISETELEYVNSYTEDSNVSQPTNEPNKALKELFPLSSFGFHIGLRFNL